MIEIENYTNMVRSIASKFTVDSNYLEDLTQEGLIGLLKAMKTFDPNKAKFSTYSYMAAKWAIIKYDKKEQRYSRLKKLIQEQCINKN